jgi:hypothetical protein
MCFGRFPFESAHNEPLDLMVLHGRYTMPPSHHAQQTRDLIAAMLQTRPGDRPDVHQVIASLRNILEPSVATPAPVAMRPAHQVLPVNGVIDKSQRAEREHALKFARWHPQRTVQMHPTRGTVDEHGTNCGVPHSTSDPFTATPPITGDSITKGEAADAAASSFNPFAPAPPSDPFAPSLCPVTTSAPSTPPMRTGNSSAPQSPVIMPRSNNNPFSPAVTPHADLAVPSHFTLDQPLHLPEQPAAGSYTGPTPPEPTISVGPANGAGAPTTVSLRDFHSHPIARSPEASRKQSGNTDDAVPALLRKLPPERGTTVTLVAQSTQAGDVPTPPQVGKLRPLDVVTALAVVTEERNDLQLRLNAAVEELEQRRMQVAEMRSLIEALSSNQCSPRRCSPVATTTLAKVPVQREEAKEYVHAALEESKDAVVDASSLRRCNSAMSFDWGRVAGVVEQDLESARRRTMASPKSEGSALPRRDSRVHE